MPAFTGATSSAAALLGMPSSAPVPVVLDVQVDERPPAAVESAAYFVVTEALTNVARHSGASRAHVSIVRPSRRTVTRSATAKTSSSRCEM